MTERTLLLMRHAEAAPSAAGRRDRDRPLTATGLRQAEAVGRSLRDGPAVGHVLCSPALRTRQTLAALGLSGAPTIEHLDHLYDAGADDIAAMITELPPDCRRALVVGHAPGLPGLTYELADPASSDAEALAMIADRFPAATVASIAVTGDWASITHTQLVAVRLPD